MMFRNLLLLSLVMLWSCASIPKHSLFDILEQEQCPSGNFRGWSIENEETAAVDRAKAMIACQMEDTISVNSEIATEVKNRKTSKYYGSLINRKCFLENASDARVAFRKQQDKEIGVVVCMSRENVAKGSIERQRRIADSLELVFGTWQSKHKNDVFRKTQMLWDEFAAIQSKLGGWGIPKTAYYDKAYEIYSKTKEDYINYRQNLTGGISEVQSGADGEFYIERYYLANFTTEPSGAVLSFNRMSIANCAKTPCSTELPEGSVSIIAVLDQYETADTTVAIEQNNQNINIKLKPNFGFLEIKPAYSEGIGKNEGWSLTIDGKAVSPVSLWDLSEMYLKDPFAWPDLWKANPHIEDPHWISPGDSIYFPGGGYAIIGKGSIIDRDSSWENRLSPGQHNVKFSHPCYEDISFEIGINRGKREVFDMASHAKLKKGGLALSAEKDGKPVSEPVFVNGQHIGETPFSGSVAVCSEIEIGPEKEKVDIKLEHKQTVKYVHKVTKDAQPSTAATQTEPTKVPAYEPPKYTPPPSYEPPKYKPPPYAPPSYTPSSNTHHWIAGVLDLIGAGLIVYGIVKYFEAEGLHDDYKGMESGTPEDFEKAWKKVKDSENATNILLWSGGGILGLGIGVHIFF